MHFSRVKGVIFIFVLLVYTRKGGKTVKKIINEAYNYILNGESDLCLAKSILFMRRKSLFYGIKCRKLVLSEVNFDMRIA